MNDRNKISCVSECTYLYMCVLSIYGYGIYTHILVTKALLI